MRIFFGDWGSFNGKKEIIINVMVISLLFFSCSVVLIFIITFFILAICMLSARLNLFELVGVSALFFSLDFFRKLLFT